MMLIKVKFCMLKKNERVKDIEKRCC